MELDEALRRRRMVRSFDGRPLPPGLVEGLLGRSLGAPRAGNTAGVAWIVLEGADRDAYWSTATTAAWRASSRRWPGLSRAPVLAVCLASPEAYAARYREPDKEASGLGTVTAGNEPAWPVPYWFDDAAFATLVVLIGATAAGVGACFLGNFRGEDDLLGSLGVPPGWRHFGTVALGYPDGRDHRSPSLDRPRPPLTDLVHHGRWTAR